MSALLLLLLLYTVAIAAVCWRLVPWLQSRPTRTRETQTSDDPFEAVAEGMTVVAIRRELAAMKMPVSGNKDSLVQRLAEARARPARSG